MNHNELDAGRRRLRQLREEWIEADKRLECIAEEIIAIETKQRARAEEYHKRHYEMRSALSEAESLGSSDIDPKSNYEREIGPGGYGQNKFKHIERWMDGRIARPAHQYAPVFANAQEADLLSFQRYTKEERGEATSALNAVQLLQHRESNSPGGFADDERPAAMFLAHKFRVMRERGDK